MSMDEARGENLTANYGPLCVTYKFSPRAS